MALDEKVYSKKAALVLSNLLDQIDEQDPDEVEGFMSQGVLKLTFFNQPGDVCVINSHLAAREIWKAYDARAWHFGWDEARGEWRDTKTDEELCEVIGATLSRRLGKEISVKI